MKLCLGFARCGHADWYCCAVLCARATPALRMYRKAEAVCPSPPEILLRWTASRVAKLFRSSERSPVPVSSPPSSLQTAPAQSSEASASLQSTSVTAEQATDEANAAARSAGRTKLVEPYGVPYEEVTRADLDSWLCRSLFAKPHCAELSSRERAELAEYVDELEAAVRASDSAMAAALGLGRDVAGMVVEQGRGVAGRVVEQGRGVAGRVVEQGRGVAGRVGAVAQETPSVRRAVQQTKSLASKGLDAGKLVVEATKGVASDLKIRLGSQGDPLSDSDEPTSSPAEVSMAGPVAASQTVAPPAATRLLKSLASLRARARPTAAVSSMCGPLDPMRWRHRPAMFYAFSHIVSRADANSVSRGRIPCMRRTGCFGPN